MFFPSKLLAHYATVIIIMIISSIFIFIIIINMSSCCPKDIINHHADETGGQTPSPNSVRIARGTTDNEGFLEVREGTKWYPATPTQWNIYEASVLCRGTGYPSALDAYLISDGPVLGISKDSPGVKGLHLYCIGNETDIDSCTELLDIGISGLQKSAGRAFAVCCHGEPIVKILLLLRYFKLVYLVCIFFFLLLFFFPFLFLLFPLPLLSFLPLSAC